MIDILVCIKEHENITFHKHYNVYYGDENTICVINDLDALSFYRTNNNNVTVDGNDLTCISDYFSTIEDFRSNQIDKII